MSRPKPVRILILGTGGMARQHAENFAAIPGVTLAGGIDNRPDQLKSFCDSFGIANRFATLDEALAWGQFDAVTNVTPDPVHFPTTMPLLAAGKHVLCEKPLATNHAHAAEMAQAAKAAGVVNMVNLTYRNVPAMQKAARMVAEGAIGPVRHFEASYLQSWLTQPAWGDWKTESQWLWRLSTAHGSKGVLGDIGIHILDFATYVAGSGPRDVSCRLTTFDKAPGGKIGEYVLDANDSFVMHMALQNGALGTVGATRFASGHFNDIRLRIYGVGGGLEVLFERDESRLNACLGADVLTRTWHPVETEPVPKNYDRFIAAIRGEGPADPDFARGAALQQVLDLAEASARAGGTSMAIKA
jgi:predicted dehydrogenase